MGVYYLDTSAIVKRYARETGTAWVVSLASQGGNDLYTVRLCGPEMIAALYRKIRTGEASRALIERAANRFRADWAQGYQIIEVTSVLADRAMALAERHGLRAYDAVHVAAALELQQLRSRLSPLIFVSADEDQLRCAAAEGLQADNPDRHV